MAISSLKFNIPLASETFNRGTVRFKWLGKISDGYFSLNSQRAKVVRYINNHNQVLIINTSTKQCLINAIKVISWLTGIIPLIMFVAKLIFRKLNQFEVINRLDEQIAEEVTNSFEKLTFPQFMACQKKQSPDYFGEFFDSYEEKWELIEVKITNFTGNGTTRFLFLQNATDGYRVAITGELKQKIDQKLQSFENLNVD